MGVHPKVINDLNALNVTILLLIPSIPFTIEANCVLKKSTLSYNPIVRAVALEALLASQDAHSTLPLSLVQRAAIKGQMMHNQEVQSVDTDEVVADEMWSFVQKNRNNVPLRKSSEGIVGLP